MSSSPIRSAARAFFSAEGRFTRGPFWYLTACITAFFFGASTSLEHAFSERAALVAYAPVYYAWLCVAVKRCHDNHRSGMRLFLLLIPFAGFIVIAFELGFKRGSSGENRFGPNRGHTPEGTTSLQRLRQIPRGQSR